MKLLKYKILSPILLQLTTYTMHLPKEQACSINDSVVSNSAENSNLKLYSILKADEIRARLAQNDSDALVKVRSYLASKTQQIFNAIELDQNEVVKKFLELGFNKETKNAAGKSMLEIALIYNSKKVIDLLMQNN